MVASFPSKLSITLPPLHPGQQEVAVHPARFRVLSCGRRWGKSLLGVALCVAAALDGKRAWWVAPSYPMSAVGWREMRGLMAQIPGVQKHEADRILVSPTGGWVQVKSADNPDSLRGEGLDFLVLDECSFIAAEAWFEALRPALSDRQGRALFISTPKGHNWFWRLWLQGQDASQSEWQSWRFPTSSNPYIATGEIEAARQSLPERIFEQEYLAAFVESAGSVFRNIAACLGAPKDTRPDQHKGHRLAAGVDWGKDQDFTAISLVCGSCGQEVARDRFNRIDYVFQRARLRALCDKWRPQIVLAESNAIGEPVIEVLHREGLPMRGFQTTATSKPPLIESLALAFERQECQWQADPVWTGELEAYERTVSPIKIGRAHV